MELYEMIWCIYALTTGILLMLFWLIFVGIKETRERNKFIDKLNDEQRALILDYQRSTSLCYLFPKKKKGVKNNENENK